MSNIIINEIYTNATENYIFGESGWFETFTDNKGYLYKELVSEYGRCISKMYRDTPKGSVPVGWVFQKRMKYEDTKETYVREVWVEIQQ